MSKAAWEMQLETEEAAGEADDHFKATGDFSYLRECRDLWKAQAESLYERLTEASQENTDLRRCIVSMALSASEEPTRGDESTPLRSGEVDVDPDKMTE